MKISLFLILIVIYGAASEDEATEPPSSQQQQPQHSPPSQQQNGGGGENRYGPPSPYGSAYPQYTTNDLMQEIMRIRNAFSPTTESIDERLLKLEKTLANMEERSKGLLFDHFDKRQNILRRMISLPKNALRLLLGE